MKSTRCKTNAKKIFPGFGSVEEITILHDGTAEKVTAFGRSTQSKQHTHPQAPKDVDVDAVQNLESVLAGLTGQCLGTVSEGIVD